MYEITRNNYNFVQVCGSEKRKDACALPRQSADRSSLLALSSVAFAIENFSEVLLSMEKVLAADTVTDLCY